MTSHLHHLADVLTDDRPEHRSMRNAAIYVRISQDRKGRALGVQRQEEDCRALCARRGWTVVDVYTDNDVSATTGRRRPAYTALLADIANGVVTAVAVWALDRLHRRPIELEDFLTLADRYGVELGSVGGDIDLGTPGGRMQARIMGAVARHEMEQKSDRTKRAQMQAAQQGRWLGGGRPFGFEADGTTIRPDEAAEIVRLTDALLAGDSLAALIRDLNARGVRSTRGKPWTYTTLRQVLDRPRNAGLSDYHGEIVGKGQWRTIVDEGRWRAVVALLGDPYRRTSRSNRGRWLLAGLARCGVCGETVKSATASSVASLSRTIYRCRTGKHLARAAVPVDALIEAVVIGRLQQPDAVDLLRGAGATPDQSALDLERAALIGRRDEATAACAEGAISVGQLRDITATLRGKIAKLETAMAATDRGRVLADLVGTNIPAVWAALPLARRRAVVDLLIEVTILPSGKRGKVFDPALIRIEWR
jgi:site-specific DNA recombinase